MVEMTIPIKRALLSVSDKSGLESVARTLFERGVEIVSSGGTGRFLKEHGIAYIPIEEVTGNPEAFQGRMKTLSFQIAGALLFRRASAADQKEAQELNIRAIDLVVCNLYPFERVAREGAELPTLIENIDIGGPTLIRAAAKNYESVTVLTAPDQYGEFLEQYAENDGSVSLKMRENFALEAFRCMVAYDGMITGVLEQNLRAKRRSFVLPVRNARELRYGENPHQRAWVYANPLDEGLAATQPLQGKALSYNNLLDADAAWKCCLDLQLTALDHQTAVCIVKHGNPCGAAVANSNLEALQVAWEGDPVSSFGGIICFGTAVDEDCAGWLSKRFIEVIVAPGFSQEALALFSKKKNLRLLSLACPPDDTPQAYDLRSIAGGWVVQTEDAVVDMQFHFVTKTPMPVTMAPLFHFGLFTGKHLKSNAIVLVRREGELTHLIGAGMGAPNRLVSLELAVSKARANGYEDLSEVLLVSDGFFPFVDNIETAHGYGIRYLIQPGGGMRDKEVIAACDERGMAMVLTGCRHFRH